MSFFWKKTAIILCPNDPERKALPTKSIGLSAQAVTSVFKKEVSSTNTKPQIQKTTLNSTQT